MQSSYQQQAAFDGFNSSFGEKAIRMAFLRKVYSILMCQLAVTLAFGTVFFAHAPTRNYVAQNPAIMWLAMIMMFVTLLVLSCCHELRRTAPTNYIFLSLFTVAESFLVGCIVSLHKLDSVVFAVGMTSIVCLGLTIFAFQTKIDFTMMGGALFVGVLILFLFGIFSMFFPSRIGSLVYSAGGAFIFSLYLIYDTQLMIGGEHKYSISPEEYVFAALNLYIDIINLFLHILSLISASRD
ncbi:protein lifeguard 1 isoform X2 [Nilaparvata lugens]|nr:protein lifeguard 1 isoform X2 [Nilaparvata lugens]XP_039284231.1 protein lifeguard 1 isoform X2 [Nilaparvata lugens]